MAAGDGERVAGVGFRQVGGQFQALAVHGVVGFAEGFREAFDAQADLRAPAGRGLADDVAGGVEIAKAQAAENGLFGVLAVVVHGIAERHAEADRIEAQLIDQLDEGPAPVADRRCRG